MPELPKMKRMRDRFRFLTVAMASIGSFALCQPAPVEQTVTARTGFQVIRSGDPTADQAVADAISRMLHGTLTRDKAVQIALLNNRRLQARFADIGVANADLIEAGLLKNPLFELLYKSPDRSGKEADIEYSIVQDFMSLVLMPLRRRVAAAELARTQAEVAHDVLQLAFDTQSAFYRMQAAAEAGELYRTAVEATKNAYEGAIRIHDAGNATDLDLHRQQALYEEQKLKLAEAEAQAGDTREELNMLMGLWGRCTDWKVNARLPEPPSRDIDLKGLETLAVCQRLDLEAARLEIETAARRLGISRITGLIPTFEAGYDAEHDTDGTWLRGPKVSFQLPLFNQGQGTNSRERAKLCRAQDSYYALAVEIRSEVRKSRQKMLKARERVKYYNTIMLPLRSRIVEETQLMFNAMDATLFELLDAKREEVTAGRELVAAKLDCWASRSELEKAVGGSFVCRRQASTAEQPAGMAAR